ncbi:hypothetical protein BJX70DRAFT_304963 [Aspergillus crustosus]
MAAPIHRHGSSLEGVIFPASQRLAPEEHEKATKLIDRIINHFEPLQAPGNDYKPITLLRLTREGVHVEDGFLVLSFTFIEHDRLGLTEEEEIGLAEALSNLHSFQEWTVENQHALDQSLVKFARFLIDSFFLPLKSLAAKTPQPTPASLSRLHLSEPAIGTPQRVSNLRQNCLQRDRHRCVVTRKFDLQEGETRYKTDGNNVKDDDENPLLPESNDMAYLEVAHIIPHSLMSLRDVEGESKLVCHYVCL